MAMTTALRRRWPMEHRDNGMFKAYVLTKRSLICNLELSVKLNGNVQYEKFVHSSDLIVILLTVRVRTK